MSENLTVRRDGPVAVVTIDRENVLNALSHAVIVELTEHAVELDGDASLRAVVLTGAGAKAFAAGADIAEMSRMDESVAESLSAQAAALARVIEESRLIWIAAVNGYALGGGCELAMCCDFIYAAETAQFGQPEVKLGVIPGFGGTQRLARRVGRGKAVELCVTGDQVSAGDALRLGLCEAVFPSDQLLTAAIAAGQRIAKAGPIAVAEAKRVIARGVELPLREALALETEAFGQIFSTEDQKEGMAAFLAKRPPAFRGN